MPLYRRLSRHAELAATLLSLADLETGSERHERLFDAARLLDVEIGDAEGAFAAIEALRTELMSTADAASKRFAQAVTDVAEVLTPEQRQKAHEWLQSRRSFWRRWHRG